MKDLKNVKGLDDLLVYLKRKGFSRADIIILPPLPRDIILVSNDAVVVSNFNLAAVEASNNRGDSLIGLFQLP